MDIFSALTSKIFGGLLLAAVAVFVYDEIADNRKLHAAEESIKAKTATITTLRGKLATSRANVVTVRAALNQCNAGVQALADQRAAMTAAGTAAVSQVRKAGERAVAQTVRAIDAMPSNGATPAAQCEQADAILLQGASQ